MFGAPTAVVSAVPVMISAGTSGAPAAVVSAVISGICTLWWFFVSSICSLCNVCSFAVDVVSGICSL